MIQKEFQRMMAELERADFQTLLEYCQLHEERKGYQPSNGRYQVSLRWKWKSFASEETELQPAEIIPWLKAKGRLNSHERQLMLRSLSIEAQFDYADGGYHRPPARCRYDDDVMPVWKEMRLQLKIGSEMVRDVTMQRDELYLGQTLLNADESALGRIIVTGLDSLSLAPWNGDEAVVKSGCPYQQLLLKQKPADDLQSALGIGSEKARLYAGVYYDQKEWDQSWVSLDIIVKQDDNRIGSQYFQRDEFKAGYVSTIRSIPAIEFLEKAYDHVTIKVRSTGNVITLQRGDEKDIMSDKYFKYTARLRTNEPPVLRSDKIHSAPMPTEWRVKAEFFPDKRPDELEGVEPAASEIVQLTKTTTDLDFNHVDDTTWDCPCIGGYVEGELLVGNLRSYSNDSERRFDGFLRLGKTLCVQVREHSYDDEATGLRTATLRLTCWKGEAAANVVKDGVMISAANEETVVVPDGVVEIANEALLTAPRMRRISLPATIRMAEGAIKKFRYENHYPDIMADYRGTLREWFENCPGTLACCCSSFMVEGKDLLQIEHLTIPADVTVIPDHAFEDDEHLRSVALHAGVVSIGERAFANCKNLEEVSVLGPADIGTEAFYGCKRLRSVWLADGVKSIGSSCFAYCESMDTLFIPKSVEVVKGYLSPQNDFGYRSPIILCEAASRPEQWNENFHEYYYDPRFGHISGHTYYHSVLWGSKRPDNP